ncbi:UNVERIFIED_CONTAM: hypothetical protein Slati_3834900 [Sesamum latifolium]|uniref:Reverse transcriptase domain-containing protein n=1 Tax=Sesamum latifolium TaxID=2727402 RepID=A0AAW2TLF0_9LAMI
MNEALIRPLAEEEITTTLKQMHRLKSLGPKNSVISPSQSASIPGRLITDNVLVAYEINNFLSHKRVRQIGYSSLKLDISKAYDQVEWIFLERVLLRLGFNQKLISLIMMSVTTVFFSFLLNVEKLDFFDLNEASVKVILYHRTSFYSTLKFSATFYRHAEVHGVVRGIQISRLAPGFSNLLFVDHTMIFCQATSEAMHDIKKMLNTFEVASGLKINLSNQPPVLELACLRAISTTSMAGIPFPLKIVIFYCTTIPSKVKQPSQTHTDQPGDISHESTLLHP